jgi:hypothetical protein
MDAPGTPIEPLEMAWGDALYESAWCERLPNSIVRHFLHLNALEDRAPYQEVNKDDYVE